MGLHYTKFGGGKIYWASRPCLSLDEAASQVQYLLTRQDTRDIYVSLATQREAETRTNGGTGRSYKVAIRLAENAVALNSLFMDIDVGKKDGYQTGAEAVTALGKFIEDAKLPKVTAVVQSGSGGLHVYWVLADALTPDEWQPLANGLCNAARQHGMHFDSQVTVDRVRILRVPGTYHWKTGTPKPVELKLLRDTNVLNEKMVAALTPYITAEDIEHKPVLERRAPIVEESEFSAGIQVGAAPRRIADLQNACPWIKHSLDTGGADNDNMLRRIAYQIATFCEETDGVAWSLMDQRATLTQEEFWEQLDRAKADREKGNRGFPTCAAISRAGATQCKTCPHLTLGKTPLTAPGALTPTNTLPVPTEDLGWVPQGYSKNALGQIVAIITDADGSQKPQLVFPLPIKHPWITSDGKEHCLQFQSTYRDGTALAVSIPMSACGTKDTLTRALFKSLVPIRADEKVLAFMEAFLQKLQSAAKSVIQSDPFGWNFKGAEYEGFTYGGKLFNAKGEHPAPPPEPALREQYMPCGADGKWIEAARLITDQQRPALDCILASAFASPLVRLVGEVDGVVIGAVSRASGVGKTTTLKIAQAVWGNPVTAPQGLDDTINSVFVKAGKIKNLPIYFDEIKTPSQTLGFVKLMFQLTGGKEKSRATREGGLAKQHSWSTLLIYASNESLYDAVLKSMATSNAGHMRMFEFTVPPITEDQRCPMLGEMVRKLRDNYGEAGLRYAKYIGENYEAMHDRINQTRIDWENYLHAEPDERFWVAALTVLTVGAQVANEIGLTSFDVDGLTGFLESEFLRMRGEKNMAPNDLSKTGNVASILGDFLAERMLAHSITTNRVLITRGKPAANAVAVEGEGTSRLDRLQGLEIQFGRENQLLRISDSALGIWLKAREISKSSFLQAMEAQLGAKSTHGRLGSGTKYADQITRKLWQIPLAGTELEQFLEGNEVSPAASEAA